MGDEFVTARRVIISQQQYHRHEWRGWAGVGAPDGGGCSMTLSPQAPSLIIYLHAHAHTHSVAVSLAHSTRLPPITPPPLQPKSAHRHRRCVNQLVDNKQASTAPQPGPLSTSPLPTNRRPIPQLWGNGGLCGAAGAIPGRVITPAVPAATTNSLSSFGLWSRKESTSVCLVQPFCCICSYGPLPSIRRPSMLSCSLVGGGLSSLVEAGPESRE